MISRLKKYNTLWSIYALTVIVLICGVIVHADTVTDSGSIVISAQVNNGLNTDNTGGGGSISSPTEVKFSGTAYPLSKIFILKNGVLATTTVADPSAKFAVTVGSLTEGSYIFSVYGTDDQDRKSTAYSFPITVTEGTSVSIGGIFLSPTIDVDKLEVKKGDPITIFGQSAPNAQVSIVVHSLSEHIERVVTDSDGAYFLRFDSAPLEYGGHITKSAAISPTDVSLFSDSAAFRVGTANIPKDASACMKLRGDLNCDGHVNLVDFSIMAYWYKKTGFPSKIDLSSDGKVTLVDFSILAYNWTG